MAVGTQKNRFSIGKSITWARENLFNTKLNSILTVVMTAIGVGFAFFLLRFVLFDANWADGVTPNLRIFILGTYPEGAEWRLWISLASFMGVFGLIFGIWGSKRIYAVLIGTVFFLLLILGFSFIPSWLNALSFGLAIPFDGVSTDPETGVETAQVVATAWWAVAVVLVGSYAVSWVPRIKLIKGRSIRSYRSNPIVLQSVLLAIVVAILITILLQQGIFPNQWGGIFIDILVFSVGGCIIMFPLGLLLALARTSRFPVLSYFATGYIEIIRAGPLVVWLIFAFFLWDSFIPISPEFQIRAMLVFGFFGAAYIAEVVRGGLQSISKGQYEAAFSLNLTTYTTYTRIILPQAIRAVVPAIIGRFISIWKDTSLLTALGITNLLGAGRSILNSDFANIEYQFEIYLVIAIVYWMVSWAFSRFGRYTEKNLNL